MQAAPVNVPTWTGRHGGSGESPAPPPRFGAVINPALRGLSGSARPGAPGSFGGSAAGVSGGVAPRSSDLLAKLRQRQQAAADAGTGAPNRAEASRHRHCIQTAYIALRRCTHLFQAFGGRVLKPAVGSCRRTRRRAWRGGSWSSCPSASAARAATRWWRTFRSKSAPGTLRCSARSCRPSPSCSGAHPGRNGSCGPTSQLSPKLHKCHSYRGGRTTTSWLLVEELASCSLESSSCLLYRICC